MFSEVTKSNLIVSTGTNLPLKIREPGGKMVQEEFAEFVQGKPTNQENEPIFIDTETCGYHSFVILIQYAIGNGPIQLVDVWYKPVQETLDLIEKFYNHEGGLVLFNATFDLYHLVKCYNTFRLVKDKTKPPDIDEVYSLIPEARDGPCLKPKHILDLFLHARKGPYQNLMDRHDIRIKRIPEILVWDLVHELEKRVPLNPIFFARKKDKNAPIWIVENSKVDDEVLPGFCDIVLRFAPSSSLKALAIDALKLDGATYFQDILPTCTVKLIEYGYDPCTSNWPSIIHEYILHWRHNRLAREYAEKDVDFTRRLYYHFQCPPFDDNDSLLAGMVPAVRFKGFSIRTEKLLKLCEANRKIVSSAPRAPSYVKKWIDPDLSPAEKLAFSDTSKETLKSIAEWKLDNGQPHPAAIKAQAVNAARKAEKENDIYEKLLQAGRFHPSFKIIGALSGRMAGADDLNPQGINKLKSVRSCFDIAFPGEYLSTGDFDAFEASIAAAAYNDEKLTSALMSGKKIGGLMAEKMFPDMDYDEIMASDGTSDNKYKLGKNGVFALIYFGSAETLADKYGIPLEIGKPAVEDFKEEYKGVETAQARIMGSFASITQPGGIGTKVIWHEPKDYIESLLGFRRYFTLENKICKALFQLALEPPEHFKRFNSLKVKRRDRNQTPVGAVMSALYGAAMQIQASVVRAAGNHEIQSTGAGVTKHLQCKIWEIQPAGIHEWLVRNFQVHDEVINACATREVQDKCDEAVQFILDYYRPKIPLIGMTLDKDKIDWATNAPKEN